MSTQLYLVPQVLDPTSGNFVPEYTDAGNPLNGVGYVSMPYDIEQLLLLACDPNDALAQQSDVFTFPLNLDTTLADADVASIQSFFEANDIPDSYVAVGITWRQVARAVAQIFQIAQRNVGLNQVGVFTTETPTTLQAQSLAAKAAQAGQSVQTNQTGASASPAENIQQPQQPQQPQPSLSDALAANAALKNHLTAVAASFGFDSSTISNGTVEDALVALGSQFTAPLVLSRNDGFTI